MGYIVIEQDKKQYMREWMRMQRIPAIFSTAPYLRGPKQYKEDVINETVGENSGYFKKKYHNDEEESG